MGVTVDALWVTWRLDKIEKIQKRATKMIPKIGNHCYHQRIEDLDLICLVQRRLRGHLIDVSKYLNVFTTASLGNGTMRVTILGHGALWFPLYSNLFPSGHYFI